jgi:hypothetical protein
MRSWPRWLESLRPDDLTSARLRSSIVRAAEPLLEARRDDWWDVASRWAGLLTPVAAALVLVFGGLALRDGVSGESLALAEGEPTPDLVELLHSEVAPAGFSEFDTNADVVFAALGEAARQRPRAAPAPRPDATQPRSVRP